MRILFVADTLAGGGKERRLVELIKGLSHSSDYSVFLLILDGEIHYKDINNTNCKVKNLNRTHGFEFNISKGISKTISEFKPDIIHFWGDIGMFYLLPNLIFGNIPMVNSVIANTSPKKGFVKTLVRKIAFKYSALILSNTYLGLKNYNAPTARSKVIYNGFDFKRLSALLDENVIRNRYNITSKYVIMMIGEYSGRKDHRTFLLATEKILGLGIDITVITAGNGDIEKIKTYISPKNEKHYRFLNFQDDIESIMNVASIGVLCSNVDRHGEGISNALLEFMALGKPVIASNHGGNMELIENNKSGFLVEAKNEDDLAEKIAVLLSDEIKRQLFGSRAKEIVENKFSIYSMINNFKAEYSHLISK